MFTTDASQERDDYSTNRLSARSVSNCDFSPAVYAIFRVLDDAFCHRSDELGTA